MRNATKQSLFQRLRRNSGVTDLVLTAAALPAMIFLLAGVVDVGRRALMMRDLREALVGSVGHLSGNVFFQTTTSLMPPAVNTLCRHAAPDLSQDCAITNEGASPGILTEESAETFSNTVCAIASAKLLAPEQLFVYSAEDLKIYTGVFLATDEGSHVIGSITQTDGVCATYEDVQGADGDLFAQISEGLESRLGGKIINGSPATAIPAAYLFMIASADAPSFVGSLFGVTDNKVRVAYIHALPQLGAIQNPT